MFEKNNPILITTHRTGGTVIGKMLYNIAAHKFGSKNFLNQYLSVTPLYKEVFEKSEGVIQSVLHERIVGNLTAFESEVKNRTEIQKNRMAMLNGDVKYTMKIFAYDLNPINQIFFRNNYDFIFLERRNKLEQLLSFITMKKTNKHEYKSGESYVPNTYFNFESLMLFISIQQQYNRVKRETVNPTVIYYEDFMEYGGDISALQRMLNLPVEDIPEKLKIETVPSPYTTSLEDLLVNKDEWLEHKETIVKLLEHC
jgi:LPS sulfotransferase NodH